MLFPTYHDETLSVERKLNEKFWEELIAYFPSITIGVSAMTSRTTFISIFDEENKTILLSRYLMEPELRA
jgi:hypothetical protein